MPLKKTQSFWSNMRQVAIDLFGMGSRVVTEPINKWESKQEKVGTAFVFIGVMSGQLADEHLWRLCTLSLMSSSN